ncbi:serine/threonine kinase [Schistosoma mansoni]|uniref:serine/threonine kinase n=1 Tax=Schistosoma mansoni TaxID=6183 RepID=UPI0001A61CFE|nr:serine/threonine kinase [Schistosoma mansoni]|eukprot:XP_018651559.1 serine/threonine kinase [Schistosoma mansoni]
MIESKVRSLQYIFEFPQITDLFNVSERQGQGTFASVLAVRSKQDPDESKYYALKMIIPTVDVRRIENEIRILRRLGGKHNVIQMHTAMRIRDHVFILMPFIDYIPFTEYYLTADEKEIRRYMRALLSALAHVHKYKVIHRDVKPTNFLMDQKTKQFFLVDFGLAHSEDISENNQRVNVTNRENSYTHKRDCVDSTSTLFAYKCNSKIDNKSSFKGASVKSSQTISNNLTQSLGQGGCVCGSRLTVCRGCRHLPRAPTVRRGGTLGFRPPEVMMRHIEQTTAVDIWAVGIIFISFLSGRYPFIKVEDDLDVLHAFTHLIGYERMQMGARSIGRRLLLDPRPPPMEASDSPVMWLKIRLYEKKFAGLPPLLRKTSTKSTNLTNDNSIQTTELSNGKPMIALSSTHIFPTSAYDLLARLLEPCPQKRITAQDALHHPYFCNDKTQRHSSIPIKYPNIQSSALLHKRTSRSSFCETTTNFIPRPQFC